MIQFLKDQNVSYGEIREDEEFAKTCEEVNEDERKESMGDSITM